jgi:Mg2+/Co2+ transporter CorB
METAPTSVLVAALVALLAVMAFSSGTEVAMLGVNRYRIRHKAEAGHRRARLLEALLARPDDWLGVNVVILATSSVFASQVATILAQRIGYDLAVPVAGILLVVVMIVLCELAPKAYAALHAESVSLASARINRALLALARPLLWLTNRLAHGFLRLFGVVKPDRSGHTLSAEELRMRVTEASPLLPSRHRQMLLSILDLERATVNDIMIPRQEISGIDLEERWEDILEILRHTPHTRLPVFRGELDRIVGLLHMKRVAQELARGTLSRERLGEIAESREPYFVPEGTSLTTQLTHFQRNRRRMAFVVDEYGDIVGLVTLEDLLEEIVGEFTTDPATLLHKDVHEESPGIYIVNASATLRALNRSLGWPLPTDGPKTLNGLLLERLETIPEPGVSVRIGDQEFEVLQIGDNAIRTVRVRTIATAGE